MLCEAFPGIAHTKVYLLHIGNRQLTKDQLGNQCIHLAFLWSMGKWVTSRRTKWLKGSCVTKRSCQHGRWLLKTWNHRPLTFKSLSLEMIPAEHPSSPVPTFPLSVPVPVPVPVSLPISVSLYLCISFYYSETRLCYVAQAGLQLSMWYRLVLILWQSFLWLLRTGNECI